MLVEKFTSHVIKSCFPGEKIRTFSLETLKNTWSEKSQNPALTKVFILFSVWNENGFVTNETDYQLLYKS